MKRAPRGKPSGVQTQLPCRMLGHLLRFHAEGPTLHWRCARCGHAGARTCRSEAHARRCAAVFDRDDRAAIGRRPLLSLLPLALTRSRRG